MNLEDFDPATYLGLAIFFLSILAIWTFFKCIDIEEETFTVNDTLGKKNFLRSRQNPKFY